MWQEQDLGDNQAQKQSQHSYMTVFQSVEPLLEEMPDK